MPSNLVLSCVLALTYWFGAGQALGQSKAGSDLELEVREDDQPAQACLTADQLRVRVAHYGAGSATPRGLRLVLYITGPNAAELQIVRGSEVLSRRRFEQLPAPCADRRDAVALSIALALERTVASERDLAEVESTSEPAPTSTASSANASASTAASAADSQAQQATSEARETTESEPAAAETVPVTQPEPEPAGPIVLGTMPSSTSHDVRRKGSSSTLQLHLGGRVAIETVPVPVWVGSLGIELPLAQSVTLDLSALASSVGESALAGARARASFLGLEALGCGALPFGVFALQICGGAAVGLCTVSGEGYPRARPEATLLWAAGLARVMLRWPGTGSFAVRALVQPHVSLSRPDLHVQFSTARLRTSWLGGSAGLELWLALP